MRMRAGTRHRAFIDGHRYLSIQIYRYRGSWSAGFRVPFYENLESLGTSFLGLLGVVWGILGGLEGPWGGPWGSWGTCWAKVSPKIGFCNFFLPPGPPRWSHVGPKLEACWGQVGNFWCNFEIFCGVEAGLQLRSLLTSIFCGFWNGFGWTGEVKI